MTSFLLSFFRFFPLVSSFPSIINAQQKDNLLPCSLLSSPTDFVRLGENTRRDSPPQPPPPPCNCRSPGKLARKVAFFCCVCCADVYRPHIQEKRVHFARLPLATATPSTFVNDKFGLHTSSHVVSSPRARSCWSSYFFFSFPRLHSSSSPFPSKRVGLLGGEVVESSLCILRKMDWFEIPSLPALHVSLHQALKDWRVMFLIGTRGEERSSAAAGQDCRAKRD